MLFYCVEKRKVADRCSGGKNLPKNLPASNPIL